VDHGPGLLKPFVSQIWMSVREWGAYKGWALAPRTLVLRLAEELTGDSVPILTGIVISEVEHGTHRFL